MKISIDQAITATGCVAFHEKGIESTTVTPGRGLKGPQKHSNMASQILAWFHQLERTYPLDPITDVCLEEFVKFVPRERINAIMRLERFTGYLWAQIENWAILQNRSVNLTQQSKGNYSKAGSYIIAKSRGFAGGSEHEIDAYVQGLLAGFDK